MLIYVVQYLQQEQHKHSYTELNREAAAVHALICSFLAFVLVVLHDFDTTDSAEMMVKKKC